MTFSWTLRPLRRFARQERGSVAVEAVILLPLVIWTFLALYAAFHSYRTYAINQKAAYTIGDMISRETNPMDLAYLNGTHQLFAYLTGANQQDLSIRLTAVYYDEDTETYELDWSQATGGADPATVEQVAGWEDNLPVLPDQERVMVVETFHNYDPPFATGLNARTVANFIFTRPRYAPQILWED